METQEGKAESKRTEAKLSFQKAQTASRSVRVPKQEERPLLGNQNVYGTSVLVGRTRVPPDLPFTWGGSRPPLILSRPPASPPLIGYLMNSYRETNQ